VSGSGIPTSARAKYLIDLLQGSPIVPAPSFDSMTAIANSGRLVPQCAMRVQRTKDGGDLSLYQPAVPCGCFFEATATGTTPSGCVQCSTAVPCATGTCRYGFCEAN
jgi:hypothetical protein